MKYLGVMIVVAGSVLLSEVSFSATYSTAKCNAWFASLDRNKDGTLGKNEKATELLSRVTLANDEKGEYIMSKSFFMIECKIGSLGKPPI